MPLTTLPPVAELSDFSAGWKPDAEPTALPPQALLEVSNLLPDVGGTLRVRKGFKRIASAGQGFRVESLRYYNRAVGTTKGRYLMVVATAGVVGVNNVRVFAVNLASNAVSQVSPNTKNWASADGVHWGVTIDQTYYGGGPGDTMYSWNPDDGWNDTPAAHNFPTLVDQASYTGAAGTIASDYAFTSGTKVAYSGLDYAIVNDADHFAPRHNARRWKVGVDYRIGDRVLVKTVDGNAQNYLKVYRCIKVHTSDAPTKPANVTYWSRTEPSLPVDEDGDITDDWRLVTTAAKTNVAAWHNDRLWLRWDDLGGTGKTRLQYSALSKSDNDAAVPNLEWDPQDFRLTDEVKGAGWLASQPEPITGVFGYGSYLLVFFRHSVKAISGNPPTWSVRDIGDVGCVGQQAMCEHDGLVYFVSDQGFYVTDGTQTQRVNGGDAVQRWLREAVAWDTADIGERVKMWSHDGFVWCALPTGSSGRANIVLAYSLATESFWPLDLEVEAVAVGRDQGEDQLYFSSPTKVGTEATATYKWLVAPRRSQSRRTTGASVETNLFSNPSFEPMPGQTIKHATATSGWTHGPHVHTHKSVEAKRRGKLGMKVSNTKGVAQFEGITQDFPDSSGGGTHNISFFVRKAKWRTGRKVGYSHVRLYVDDELTKVAHTYTYIGHGWWRVSATYTGSADNRNHGIVFSPGKTEFHVDKALCISGALVSYFDGDGGDAAGEHDIVGGVTGRVYQYDHADVQDDPTDDDGLGSYTAQEIPWVMRTAWLPFGTQRQERRIRRVWALVRGSAALLLRGYRNYDDEVCFESEATPNDTADTTYVEGRVMPDAYSVSLAVEGLGAPAAVLGVALHTEPRRIRYHSDI